MACGVNNTSFHGNVDRIIMQSGAMAPIHRLVMMLWW